MQKVINSVQGALINQRDGAVMRCIANFKFFILVLGTIHVKMLSFVFARPGTRYKSSISVHGTYA